MAMPLFFQASVILRIEPYGLVVSLNSFIAVSLFTESYTFVIPGRGILRIEFDGLVISLNSFIVVSQFY